MISFDDATLFKTIVDQGSLVKAANYLKINPSAVSKRLSKLEYSLGVQLLTRTTRRIALTESGQYFYNRLADVEIRWQSALDETRCLSRTPSGTLKIAAPQPVASRILVPIFSQFQQRYPEINLDLQHQQYESLPSASADLTICRELENYQSSSVVMHKIFDYQNQLFAAPSYLDEYSTPIKLSHLKHHKGLIYGIHENQSLIQKWRFISEEAEIKKSLTTNNTEILISAAKQGLGLIYIPKMLIKQELMTQQLLPVLEQEKSQTYRTCAYFVKTDFVVEKVQLFIDFLKEKTNK